MKLYRLSGATFYDCIYTIYQFSKPLLENKMSVFEDYGTFNVWFNTFGLARRGSTIRFHLLWHTVELAMSTRLCLL